MKLTRAERWILYNQYQILEMVADSGIDKQHCRAAQEVFLHGYQGMYHDYCPADNRETTDEECKEIIDILSMYRALTFSYQALADQSEIDAESIKFRGFDGNDGIESRYRSFVKFFCDEQSGKRFEELDRTADFNSHAPMLDTYRNMLNEWRRIEHNRSNLSKSQIETVLAAGRL